LARYAPLLLLGEPGGRTRV